MEDDLNFFGNGRRPQFFAKMEDDLNFLGKMEDDLIFLGKMEDDLKCKINGRRPQMEDKWKYSTVS